MTDNNHHMIQEKYCENLQKKAIEDSRNITSLGNIIQKLRYSVTQTFANSFGGYVVLDTFNNVAKDEDNIIDQIYVKQICPAFYHDDF